MGINEDLAGIRGDLNEATGEIVAKIDELAAQAGDKADPALVEEVKSLAQNLAGIVPDATPAPPEPEPAEPEPAEPETPAESTEGEVVGAPLDTPE